MDYLSHRSISLLDFQDFTSRSRFLAAEIVL